MEPSSSDQSSKKRNWKQFQMLSVDSKNLKKQAAKVESATTKHAHRFLFRRIDNLRYVRKHVITWFIVVGVVLVGIALQLFVSSRSYSAVSAVNGGTFAEGVVGNVETLNPLQASSGAEVSASRLMFSSLYEYDEKGSLRPDVARNLAVDKTGRIYTVKIREDVSWHDGRPMTGDDVLFTIGTIKDPESRSRSSLRANWQDVNVELLDKYTLKFTLPAYAAFPHALTFPIVPKHLLEALPPSAIPESTFSSAPVGSGPFVFRFLQNADAVSNHRTVHMTSNSQYYKRIPRLSRFELHAYPDDTALADAIRRREVTAGAGASQDTIASLQTNGFQIKSYNLDNGVYLLLNNSHAILKDKQVRQALQRGIDTARIAKVVGNDAEQLHLPFLPSHIKTADLPASPEHDIETARALLDQAGWRVEGEVRKNGKTELSLTLTTIRGTQFETVVDEIADQLQKLQIKVTKNIIDDRAPNSNFRQDVLQQRNYDMLVYELPIGADPDVYAYWHSSQLGASGYNFANYSNIISDAALVSARDRIDADLREAKYVTFAHQWLGDAASIGLYQQIFTYVSSKNAETLAEGTVLVMSADRYSNVERWSVARGQVYKTP